MSRRPGQYPSPRELEPLDGRKPRGTRGRANLGQRGKKIKRRPPSEGTGSSESLFHLEDAAAFHVAVTEGDTFRNTGQFKRAIQSYTRALEKQPSHRACLLARSHCYQQVGDSRRALADANKALQEDQEFIKGLLQKAECYYNMGEFEFALVHYHRGQKLRPEIQAFRLGVQKSQAAIENCIGDRAGTWLTKDGDLSFFADEQKPDASRRREAELVLVKDDEGQMRGQDQGSRSHRGKVALGSGGKQGMDKQTVKQLLGELYADKEYLEKLLQETEKVTKSKAKDEVLDLTTTCLDYLDTRAEFWSQQQPRRSKIPPENSQNPSDIKYWLYIQHRDIDRAIDNRQYNKAVNKCKVILEKFENREVEKYGEVVALAHSRKGLAHLELDEREKAFNHHRRDLEISGKIGSAEGVARALENLVYVHLKYGEYSEAADIFGKILTQSTTPLEQSWLHHEIGKCHFELKNYHMALECGQKSLQAALEGNDYTWQLNANVLIAQSNYEIGDYEDALTTLNVVLLIAEQLKDRTAEKAIKEAILRVREKLTSSRTITSDKEIKTTDDGVDIAEENQSKKSIKAVKTEEKVTDDEVDTVGLADTYKIKEPETGQKVEKTDSGKESPTRAEEKSEEPVNTEITQLEDTYKLPSPGNSDEKEIQETVNEVGNKDTVNEEKKESVNEESEKDIIKEENKEDPILMQEQHAFSENQLTNTAVRQDNVSEVKVTSVNEATETRRSTKLYRDYQITLRISDLEEAGTEKDIYVQLEGDKAVSREENLERPEGSRSFERGKSYTCQLSLHPVGKITKLRVRHSGTQPGEGCHIAEITVMYEDDSSEPITCSFECNQWFDRGQGDGMIKRELVPSQ